MCINLFSHRGELVLHGDDFFVLCRMNAAVSFMKEFVESSFPQTLTVASLELE